MRKKQKRIINLIGRRFGRLTVQELDETLHRGGNRWWKCVCDCGNKKLCSTKSLLAGYSKSCGCMQKEARNTTLCWQCANATNSALCTWVNDYTPVDGWTAVPTVIKNTGIRGSTYTSYRIKSCPMFVPDGKNRKNDDRRKNDENNRT